MIVMGFLCVIPVAGEVGLDGSGGVCEAIERPLLLGTPSSDCSFESRFDGLGRYARGDAGAIETSEGPLLRLELLRVVEGIGCGDCADGVEALGWTEGEGSLDLWGADSPRDVC